MNSNNKSKKFIDNLIYDLKGFFVYKPSNISLLLLLVPGVFLGLFMGQHINAMYLLGDGYDFISFYLFILILLGCISMFNGFSFTSRRSKFNSGFSLFVSILILTFGILYIYQYFDFNANKSAASEFSMTNSNVLTSIICVGISMLCSLAGSIFTLFCIEKNIEKES